MMCWPGTTLAMPSWLKIHPHRMAETAVGMAHGTRMAARTKPRPRIALCMMSAMAMPRTVSRTTVTTPKSVVFQAAVQNRSPAEVTMSV